jgi:SAM-dependent methyltransferase
MFTNEISPTDLLFDYLLRVPMKGDRARATGAYLSGGRDCAQRFATLCREYGDEPKSVLEFASGYGRVARHVAELAPALSWTCCDIHPQAVAFISEKIGLRAFLSTTDPAQWAAPALYDVVFALSFFSHTPDHRFGPWLAALVRAATPGGLLIFTTHGETSIAKNYAPRGIHIDLGAAGHHWSPNSDQLDLDPIEYGTSFVTRAYVEDKIGPCGALLDFRPGYWWGHQDLYILRTPSE